MSVLATDEPLQWRGRVVVVTGGANGIGWAISRACLEAGARVAVVDLTPPSAGPVGSDPAASEGSVLAFVEADVADEDQVVAAFAQVTQRFGRIDVLVNNAGIFERQDVAEAPTEHWDRIMGVNLRSVFLCSRAAIPVMRAHGGGVIINMGSQIGQLGEPGAAAYCASKAAILGLTRAMARELIGDGIRVDAIAPGPIETPMHARSDPAWQARRLEMIPLGRFGSVADVAASAMFLASDEAALYVGQTLSPSGGEVMI